MEPSDFMKKLEKMKKVYLKGFMSSAVAYWILMIISLILTILDSSIARKTGDLTDKIKR